MIQDVDRAADDFRVAGWIAIAAEVEQHILLVMHVHMFVNHDDEFREWTSAPAPQIACMTRRALETGIPCGS